MAGERAVVLVSGGMDSCVTAAIASKDHEMAFAHFSYGQRTEARELACFIALAEHFRVGRRLTARLDHLKSVGGSSLTDTAMAIPAADLRRTTIPATYVPFRNAQFLAAAAAWAETIDARRIYIGAVEEDSSGYPDCRRDFYDVFEKLIDVGTRPGTSITIITPIIHLSKTAIVRRGAELGAPFHLTWSCYADGESPCRGCDSCALRERAFREAGMEDPLLAERDLRPGGNERPGRPHDEETR